MSFPRGVVGVPTIIGVGLHPFPAFTPCACASNKLSLVFHSHMLSLQTSLKLNSHYRITTNNSQCQAYNINPKGHCKYPENQYQNYPFKHTLILYLSLHRECTTESSQSQVFSFFKLIFFA